MSRCASFSLETILVAVCLSALLADFSSGSRFPILTMAVGDVSSPGDPETTGANETSSSSSSLVEEESNATRCDDARMRCAYRTGCGRALTHYLTRCASVLQGDISDCPEFCQHALIGLTSTDEGKELMNVSVLSIFFFSDRRDVIGRCLRSRTSGSSRSSGC